MRRRITNLLIALATIAFAATNAGWPWE